MSEAVAVQARRIHVKGIVQGVGFRPFIYQLAQKNSLTGWVSNTSGDVTIEIEGAADSLERFASGLRVNAPPQARIESVTESEVPPRGFDRFEIRESLVRENEYQLISPDLATCPTCRKEIFDPEDRRYRYPFTNCTNCGPRFTIIEDIPYDRPLTTMHNFTMCPDCQREYDEPTDRRFHAQPNACPVCGPKLKLVNPDGSSVPGSDPVRDAGRLIREGSILAIKGLGGFLLACDATSNNAVNRLRERKKRPAKPFAIMLRDVEEAKRYCRIEEREIEALTSPASPIVLVKKREDAGLSPAVAPGLRHLGVMLPYTPLHYLLMDEAGLPLVMTSGNLSEEPIAKDNEEALSRLAKIADFFLLHDRDIRSRYDDSVATVEQNEVRIVRRARGYAPYPIQLPFQSKPVLACGPEMKNSVCLTRDHHAFVSQHIGDMENLDTLEHFENTIELYKKLFRIHPQVIACDLHPDYLSTRWAEEEAERYNLPLVRVQHHHAHIASCMAENGVQEPVIGIAMDGTGYGTDGHIWGCEFMVCDYKGFERKAHLEYLPLPGGEAAIRKPYRIGVGYLYALLGNEGLRQDWPGLRDTDESEIELIKKQVDRSLNTPLTSSCGRLFDAVSALLGIRREIDYDGQAAIELEEAAGDYCTEVRYPYQVEIQDGIRVIKIKEILESIGSDIRQGKKIQEIAARFHNTMTDIIIELCLEIAEETGVKQAAISGGVFQNRRILNQTVERLRMRGLTPWLHRQVPCNDGCISLGQAVIANFEVKQCV